jgi:hypothetical protein
MVLVLIETGRLRVSEKLASAYSSARPLCNDRLDFVGQDIDRNGTIPSVTIYSLVN